MVIQNGKIYFHSIRLIIFHTPLLIKTAMLTIFQDPYDYICVHILMVK